MNDIRFSQLILNSNDQTVSGILTSSISDPVFPTGPSPLGYVATYKKIKMQGGGTIDWQVDDSPPPPPTIPLAAH